MKLKKEAVLCASLILSPAVSSKENDLSAKEIFTSLKSRINESLLSRKNEPIKRAKDERILVQCLDDEIQFLNIESNVLVPLTNYLKGSLSDDGFFDDSVWFSGFRGLAYGSGRDLGGFTLSKGLILDSRDMKIKSRKALKKFFKGFSKLDDVEIAALEYFSPVNMRHDGKKMNSARIRAMFDVRGFSQNGELLQQRGEFLIYTSVKKGKWVVEGIRLANTEKLVAKAPLFKNITNESKIASVVPRHLRREAIRRGGYAMALGNGGVNKPSDIFVATVAETVYLKGDKNLNYKVNKQDSLEKESFVKAASFADFDKDGKDELLLVRFAPNEVQSKKDRSDILIYKTSEAGVYKPLREIISFSKKTAYAMPLALGDFDSDGFLDFYVGFPGAKDFTTLEEAKQKEGLETQGLFYNKLAKREGLFEYDEKQMLNMAHAQAVASKDDVSRIFPHSAIAADLHGNGKTDLIVVDDRANVSPIYLNQGQNKFELGRNIGIGLKDYGMGADIGDLNGDGYFDVVLSSVNFNSSRRIKTSCSLNWSLDHSVSAGVSGLRAFQGGKNQKFSERTEELGLGYIGDGAGGVKIFDYNNDGHEDIYVSMGLWSGNSDDKSSRLDSYFTVASTLGLLDDQIKSGIREKVTYGKAEANSEFASLLFRSDSQSLIMDILSYYREGKNSMSLAGHQRNRLFHNNGDGTFTEVGFVAGVDSIADGYMPAIADLNRDGKLDLILRNADPGYAKDQFSPVEIYKNQSGLTNAVTIKLKGVDSNPDGVGAILDARIENKKLKRQLIGSSGTVQSERIIHFGLNGKDKIDELSIMWPSGVRQVVRNVPMGYHVISEMPLGELTEK